MTARFGVYNNIEQSMEHGCRPGRVVPGLVPLSPEEVPSPAASWRRRRSPAEGSQVRGATWRSAAAEASDPRGTRRSIMAGMVEVAGSGVTLPLLVGDGGEVTRPHSSPQYLSPSSLWRTYSDEKVGILFFSFLNNFLLDLFTYLLGQKK
jgi:hypothetical protein